MIIKTTPESAPKVNAPIDGRIMFQHSDIECILLTLQAGEEIPAHSNPFDVLFIAIAGEVYLNSNEEIHSLHPGETLFIPRELDRHLQNRGNEISKLMVVKLIKTE